MFFIAVDPNDFSVTYAKRIAERIIDYDQKHAVLSDEQRQTLHTITRPTMGNHEDEIKQLCEHLIQTLVITDSKGETLKFYRDDEQGLLYFGDEAGWHAGRALHKHPTLDPDHLNQD
ncbi:hypothetical protein U0021_05725 [Moraxella canis]|uniref:Uncharacterized protein n=1 Tax=Moraxella canis TaxID=90239 RepID=A0ABZ0WVK0_9GAMM|nr:hypothetical protein [Moraxella canis]WQE03272.1 hypothetical protein U0021_05725 [Moraxella canis]